METKVDLERTDFTLSVLMPVYNEINTIEEIIGRVLKVPLTIELIIVDDGSIDGTRDFLKQINIPNVRVFFNEKNLGKGGALREAYKHATGDYCIIQDADLEYDPKEYPILLDLLVSRKADVVYGSRFLYRTRVFYFYNLMGNKVINIIMNVLFNATFTDLETCYKAFKREVLKDFPFQMNSFAIEIELTAYILLNKFKVFEVPISFYGRTYEEGKKITWRDGVAALYYILLFRFIGVKKKQSTK